MMELKEIDELIKAVSKFPGLGPKSAKRIILKLINNKDEIMKPTINALANVYKNISRCNYCGTLKSLKEECRGYENCSNLQKKCQKINIYLQASQFPKDIQIKFATEYLIWSLIVTCLKILFLG